MEFIGIVVNGRTASLLVHNFAALAHLNQIPVICSSSCLSRFKRSLQRLWRLSLL